MSWERSTKCVGKKVFEWVGQKSHTILPIRYMLISPEIQSSSTCMYSPSSRSNRKPCVLFRWNIDNHKSFGQYIPNKSCSSLGSQVSTDASTASSQRLKLFWSSLRLAWPPECVHLYASFLASKVTFQYASMWSIEMGLLLYPCSSCPIHGGMEI